VVPAAAVVLVDGVPQRGAQCDSRAAAISMPANPVIANMCSRARDLAPSHDVLLNFAYDWLPFYLTAFFPCPVAHWVLMASLSNAMDHVIGDVATRFPGTVASCTRAQAETFPFADKLHLLGAGLDLTKYEFCAKPDAYLAWMGRISPEKGLEDAAAAARLAGLPLKVMGLAQDPDYLASVRSAYPEVIEHVGFLAMPALQEVLRRASALLVTPLWVEALGMVLLEALACGVPVVAYRRGGPADIVRDGETGWLVTPGSVADLARAVGRLGAIDRRACRAQVEREHDIRVVGGRIERWLDEVAGR
jgi:UDP-glucose:tetrahydrobiopterin glucosyltransferase